MGQAARGSGALLGHVDISIETAPSRRRPADPSASLLGSPRHAATPRQLLLELNADGADYVAVTDADEDDLQSRWEPLRLILMDAPQKLTREDILAEWPPDWDAPKATSLWRLLRRAVERGLIACQGAGRRSDPFRYWLPQREAVWREHPLYDLLQQHERTLNLPFESLQERERKLRRTRDE